MIQFDCNCYVGNWPFHKVRRNSFEEIKKLHLQNGIEGGFVSSLEAIFYNDPWEADAELHEAIQDEPNYHHVMTVNPMLPGAIDSIHRAVKEWGVRGVRLLPGFHGYTLTDDKVRAVCDVIRAYDLIVFITVRMEDERNTYFFHPRSINGGELTEFFYINQSMKAIICGGWNGDMAYLRPILDGSGFASDVYWDCSAMRGGLYIIDDLYKQKMTDRLLYGSMAPIFVLKSTRLLVETADIPEEEKEKILTCKNIRDKGWMN